MKDRKSLGWNDLKPVWQKIFLVILATATTGWVIAGWWFIWLITWR